MKYGRVRPNRYKQDIEQPTWWQEVRAWLVVVVLILALRGLYYLVEGV